MLELDPYKVGEALMMIGVTSHRLGHSTIQGTVDPYLLSAPRERWSPEQLFVIDLLLKPADEVIPMDEVIAMGRNRPRFNPEDYPGRLAGQPGASPRRTGPYPDLS